VPHHIGFTLDEGGDNGPTSLVRLGFWLGTQRKYKKAGKLKPEYEARLQELVNEGKMKWSMRSKSTPRRSRDGSSGASSTYDAPTTTHSSQSMSQLQLQMHNHIQATMQTHLQQQLQQQAHYGGNVNLQSLQQHQQHQVQMQQQQLYIQQQQQHLHHLQQQKLQQLSGGSTQHASLQTHIQAAQLQAQIQVDNMMLSPLRFD